MGNINLAQLPSYFDLWKVPYRIHGDWLNVGRSSGGFDEIKGVMMHHTATPIGTKIESTISYALTGPNNPVANGCVTRTKDGPEIVLWAGLASNHAGKGGPRLTSRGVVPLDSANSRVFGMEAENNGIGEPWPDEMCDLYVRAMAAVIDWANHTTDGATLSAGDVWSHKEWAPSRKIDPAGPSRFNNYGADGHVWGMDQVRGEILAALIAGPNPSYDDEMPTLYRDSRFANVFLVNGDVTTIGGKLYASLQARGVAEVVDTHDQSLISFMRKAQIKTGMLVASSTPGPFNAPVDLVG